MNLNEYVGKYGVLNNVFHSNTANRGNKLHVHSYELAEVLDVKESSAIPLLVSVGGEKFKIHREEINLLDDNDPIIKLEVGQPYDSFFNPSVITMIDYKYRKMELKYGDGSSEVVDVPKVAQTPIREIPVLSIEELVVNTNVVVDEDMVIHKQLLDKLHEVIKAKRSDYGDSFGKQYSEYGILSALIRLEDKLNRLKSLTVGGKKQQVSDESVYDTVLDLNGYSSLLLLQLEKDKINEK